MGNKLFALASVSALSGLVAATSASGCSSTEVITQSGDGGRDARNDRLGDQEEPLADTCMADQLLDHTTVGYKAAAVNPGKCTLGAIKVLEDLVKSKPGGVPFGDVKKALEGHDATCAKCVFAEETDKWAPIVEKAGKVIVNVGGCIEVVSGKTACGKAWQQFDTCTNFGCKDCTTDAEQTECFKSVGAKGGPCEAATRDLQAACGTDLLDYVDTCYPDGELTIAGPIKKQCIEGTVSDAGSDG
jgi:hypothetical protein